MRRRQDDAAITTRAVIAAKATTTATSQPASGECASVNCRTLDDLLALTSSARRSRGARRRCRAAGAADPSADSASMRRRRFGGVRAGSSSPARARARGRRCRRRCRRRTPAAREHLVKHAAERPDVGALVDRSAARLLGAHVGRGAEDHAGRASPARVIVGDRDRVRDGGSVGVDLRPGRSRAPSPCRRRRDLDVGRLQIAMDDAVLVRGFERLGNLARDRRAPRRAAAGRARADRRASAPSTSSRTSARACRRLLEAVDLRDVRDG